MKGLPRILNRTISKMLNVKSYYSSLSHRSGEYGIASTITLELKANQKPKSANYPKPAGARHTAESHQS